MLLKRDLPEQPPSEEAPPSVDDADVGGKRPRIRCPRCRWQPRKDSRWLCNKCNTSWNTFDTRGLCPGCNHQWIHTACLDCHAWSRHVDWYEKSDGPPASG